MSKTIGTSPNARTASAMLDEFTDYCFEFYLIDGKNALYPFATDTEICDAVRAHMTDPNPLFPFDGDSADREAVRDRILADRRLIEMGETDFDRAVALGRMGINSRFSTHAEIMAKINPK
jgi:hypothetical protein